MKTSEKCQDTSLCRPLQMTLRLFPRYSRWVRLLLTTISWQGFIKAIFLWTLQYLLLCKEDNTLSGDCPPANLREFIPDTKRKHLSSSCGWKYDGWRTVVEVRKHFMRSCIFISIYFIRKETYLPWLPFTKFADVYISFLNYWLTALKRALPIML